MRCVGAGLVPAREAEDVRESPLPAGRRLTPGWEGMLEGQATYGKLGRTRKGSLRGELTIGASSILRVRLLNDNSRPVVAPNTPVNRR